MANSTSIWEQRFPTVVGGAPSAIRAESPLAVKLSANLRSSSPVRVPATRAATPMVPLRKEGKSRDVRVPTPQDALEAAKRANQAVIDYSLQAIRPGTEGISAVVPSPRTVGRLSPIRRERFAVHEHLALLDPTSATGFQQMEAAIERVHMSLPAMPLAERWSAIASWIDRYFDDSEGRLLVSSLRRFWQETDRRLASKPKPNGYKVAVSFMYFEQIMHMFSRTTPIFHDVASDLRDTLLEAIYFSPPSGESLNSSFFVLKDPKDVNSQKLLIERFYGKTYFQHLREYAMKADQSNELALKTERTSDKQTKVLNRVVDFWQGYTKHRILRAWSAYVTEEKSKRALRSQLEKRDDTIGNLQRDLKASEAKAAAALADHEKQVASMQAEIARLKATVAEEKEKYLTEYQEKTELRKRMEDGADNLLIAELKERAEQSRKDEEQKAQKWEAAAHAMEDQVASLQADAVEMKVALTTVLAQLPRAELPSNVTLADVGKQLASWARNIAGVPPPASEAVWHAGLLRAYELLSTAPGKSPSGVNAEDTVTNFLLKSKLAKEADASVAAHILASDENDAAEPMHLALLNYLHAYRHIVLPGHCAVEEQLKKKSPKELAAMVMAAGKSRQDVDRAIVGAIVAHASQFFSLV